METIDYNSTVDTSRPFSSVKEAVAIFGERFLAGEIYSPSPKPSINPSPKQDPSWKSFTPSPTKEATSDEPKTEFMDTLKKIEGELEETKMELKLLKERESETEVALASLNAQLHKNMSRMAQAEANAAGKAAATWSRSNSFGGNVGEREENGRREMIVRMESLPTLGQVLNFDEKEGVLDGERKKYKMMMKKKKPIIPLVRDLFSRKKRSSSSTPNLLSPLYSPSYMY